MVFLDISVPLSPQTPVYPGDPAFRAQPIDHEEPGHPDYYRLSVISMSTHTGTHIDPPRHLLQDGRTVETILPEVLCGPAVVLDLRGEGNKLDEALLSRFVHKFRQAERLLFKTDNGALFDSPRLFTDYTHLTGDGARFLRRLPGLRLVGIDALSIDGPPNPWPGFGFPAHHALLEGASPVVILETIDLRAVEEGEYELLCLPLSIRGGDGGPARAVLRK